MLNLIYIHLAVLELLHADGPGRRTDTTAVGTHFFFFAIFRYELMKVGSIFCQRTKQQQVASFLQDVHWKQKRVRSPSKWTRDENRISYIDLVKTGDSFCLWVI